MQSYYEVLEVIPTADIQTITTAFRKKALIYHPDKNTNKSEQEKKSAAAMMKELNDIHQCLIDPQKRKNYDDTLKNTPKHNNGYFYQPAATGQKQTSKYATEQKKSEQEYSSDEEKNDDEKVNESLLKNLEQLRSNKDKEFRLKILKQLSSKTNEEMQNLEQKINEEMKKLRQATQGQPLTAVKKAALKIILRSDRNYVAYKKKEDIKHEINKVIEQLEREEEIIEINSFIYNREELTRKETQISENRVQKLISILSPPSISLDEIIFNRRNRNQRITSFIAAQQSKLHLVLSLRRKRVNEEDLEGLGIKQIKCEREDISCLICFLQSAYEENKDISREAFIQVMAMILREHPNLVNMPFDKDHNPPISSGELKNHYWIPFRNICMRILLEAGANPNLVNQYQMAPLSLYIHSGAYANAVTLIQAGADVNVREGGEFKLSPLMLLAQDASYKFNEECYKHRNSSLPLSTRYYTIYGIEPLESLIQYGANINAVDNMQSWTAIDHSAGRGEERIKEVFKSSLGNLVLIHRLLIEGAVGHDTKRLLDYLSIYSTDVSYSKEREDPLFAHAITQCIVIAYEQEIARMIAQQKAAYSQIYQHTFKQQKAEIGFSQLSFQHAKAEAELCRLHPEAKKQALEALEITKLNLTVGDTNKKTPLTELIYEYSESPIVSAILLKSHLSLLSRKKQAVNNYSGSSYSADMALGDEDGDDEMSYRY